MCKVVGFQIDQLLFLPFETTAGCLWYGVICYKGSFPANALRKFNVILRLYFSYLRKLLCANVDDTLKIPTLQLRWLS